MALSCEQNVLHDTLIVAQPQVVVDVSYKLVV